MVTQVSELRAARRLITQEVHHLSRFGHGLPLKLRVGAMLEVQSLLFDIDAMMAEADFVSI